MDIGMLFGMIVALLTITLVLVYGYQQISHVSEFQETATELRAVKALETAVDRVYSMGGESSDRVRLMFPGSVDKLCFIPLYSYTQGTRKPYGKTGIARELYGQGIINDKDIANLVVEARMPGTQDKNYTLLIFYKSYEVPKWHYVANLEPGETKDGFICAYPGDYVWLQRKYDGKGAWVDAEIS